MPTTQNKKCGKYKEWERDRRNRLCIAFSDLAAVIPDVPTPATKILILQRALEYIKLLQQRGNGKENECKRYDTLENEALRKEISCLEDKCAKLIKELEITKSQNETTTFKAVAQKVSENIVQNITNKLPTAIDSSDNECSNDAGRISDDNIDDDKHIEKNEPANTELNDKFKNIKSATLNQTILKKKKVKRKKIVNKISQHIISGTAIGSITPIQSNNSNVWVANNNFSNFGSPVIVGNNILPIVPMAQSIIVPSIPQQSGFLVLQKGNSKKTNLITNTSNNLTIINPIQGRSLPNIYPGIYSVDVTKTTMVNKVPISAISSSNTYVTYRTRKKFLASLKQCKKIDQSNSINKENIKRKEKIEIVHSKCVTEIKQSEIISKSKVDETKSVEKETNEKPVKVNPGNDNVESKKHSAVLVNNDKDKNEKKQLNINKHVKELKETNVGNQSNTFCEINKEDKQRTDMKRSIKENVNKTSQNAQVNFEMNKLENYENFNPSNENKNFMKSNAKIKKNVTHHQNASAIVAQETVNTNLPDCRLELIKSIKKSDISMGTVELTEDLLASFGATNEQNISSSPLATSPLATSPTAAFLLTFPLVSQGPRPDTPSNDNLQTPNICALDHFSNFFSSKDNLPPNNPNFYIDFHTKQSISGTPEKVKLTSENIQNKTNVLQQNQSTSTGKYTKEIEQKNVFDHNFGQKPNVSSSSCIFSESQNLFHYSKPHTSNVHSTIPDSIFNYEHATVMTNISKDIKPVVNNHSKSQISFDNTGIQAQFKNKISSNENNMFYNTTATNFFGPSSSVGASSNKNSSYTLPVITSDDINSVKKIVTSEPSMKLVVPGVIPEFNTIPKSLDLQFSFPSQTRTFPPTSVYTSCNTYNQFNTDIPNSANLSSANPPHNVKGKMGYYEPNLPNNYIQCNTWTEDHMNTSIKTDQTKKYNASFNQNPNTHSNSENHSDLKYSTPVLSKTSNKSVSIDSKSRNSIKCNTKDSNKFIVNENKISKSDYISQKGPVNWMTSEPSTLQFNGNDLFFQVNNKDIKNDQMNTVHVPSQHCADPSIHPTLSCRKSELFEQPYYHLTSGSYVPQSVNEDNQFTWSPSKLAPLTDNMTSCSLPTLVGDLALGVLSDTKLPYQTLNTDDLSVKDQKHTSIKMKEVMNKNNANHNVDMPSTNTSANFFSVTQLMERGKESTQNEPTRKNYNIQCQKKGHSNETNYRITNLQTATNMKLAEPPMPTFSIDSFPMQNVTDSGPSNKQNIKIESNNKNGNKNNYSTEALLQNNQTEYNSRKYKHLQKSHEASNTVGQSISGYPLQLDAYNQSTQYMANSFPYGNTASVSNTFYTTSNFIPSSNNMMGSSYMNSGLLTDINEFSNSTSDNIFYIPKLENSRTKPQPDNIVVQQDSKDFANGKHKLEGTKKETSTKRQKKTRNLTEQFNNMSDPCYSTITNNLVPSVASDDTFFGYFTPSQSHSYTTQAGTLPASQPALHTNQRNNIPFGKPITSSQIISSSPIPVSSSLTNFNLSTIFPEINKRNPMSGMHYTTNVPSKPPVLFH